MAENTMRMRGEMLLALFQVLRDRPEGLRPKEVLFRMQVITPPTNFEKTDCPSMPGVPRYEKIMRFNISKAVKAGWIIKTRTTCTLTDEGRKAFGDFDAESLARKLLPSKTSLQSAEVEPGETAVAKAITHEKAEETAWEEIEFFFCRTYRFMIFRTLLWFSLVPRSTIGMVLPVSRVRCRPDRLH